MVVVFVLLFWQGMGYVNGCCFCCCFGDRAGVC